jgi:hypothetical protein
MIEWLNEDVSRHPEPAAQIVPERDAELVAGLGEIQKRVAAIATDIAACSGAERQPTRRSGAILDYGSGCGVVATLGGRMG